MIRDFSEFVRAKDDCSNIVSDITPLDFSFCCLSNEANRIVFSFSAASRSNFASSKSVLAFTRSLSASRRSALAIARLSLYSVSSIENKKSPSTTVDPSLKTLATSDIFPTTGALISKVRQLFTSP